MKALRFVVPLCVIVGLVVWVLTQTSRKPDALELALPPVAAPAVGAQRPAGPTPAAQVAEPRPSVPGAVAPAGPVDKHGEPLMVDGKFAGFTRNHWREHYTRTMEEKQQDLAETRRIVEQAERGERIDPQELKIARLRIAELTRALELARQELDELSRAK